MTPLHCKHLGNELSGFVLFFIHRQQISCRFALGWDVRSLGCRANSIPYRWFSRLGFDINDVWSNEEKSDQAATTYLERRDGPRTVQTVDRRRRYPTDRPVVSNRRRPAVQWANWTARRGNLTKPIAPRHHHHQVWSIPLMSLRAILFWSTTRRNNKQPTNRTCIFISIIIISWVGKIGQNKIEIGWLKSERNLHDVHRHHRHIRAWKVKIFINISWTKFGSKWCLI